VLVKSEIPNVCLYLENKIFQFKDGVCEIDDGLVEKVLSLGYYSLPVSERLNNYKNILVIRNCGLGDVILCIPLLKFIRKRSRAKITFATNIEYLDFCKTYFWFVNEVISTDKISKSKFDLVINLNEFVEKHNKQKYVKRIELFASAINCELEDKTINIEVKDLDLASAKNLILENYNGEIN